LNDCIFFASFFSGRCDPKRWIRKRLPILEWLPLYNVEFAISDFIAGLTVGLTAIPQGIAYALVAHLPAQVTIFFHRIFLVPSFAARQRPVFS
jgi:sodium-independent sulfate anion transporter 11